MPFTFSGTVQRHLGRGKQLGYPTANIFIPLDFPEGIFIGYATLKEARYPALVFIGQPLTFEEHDKKAEVYILDFNKEIYGMTLDVEVIKKIRENQKFSSHDALIHQIKQDEEEARDYFKKTV